MSFKEFDMTKYYNVWIEFKKENKERVIKTWGSIDKCAEATRKDLSKDPSSNEIQQIAKEITDTVKKDYEIFKMDRGDNHWYHMMSMTDPKWIQAVDNKYGKGAAKFIKEVFKIYLRDKQPK